MTPRIVEGFRTGQGVGWHEHGHGAVRGHRASSSARATARTWSPSGFPPWRAVEAKLQAGIRRRRCRLRARRLDHPARRGLPELDVRGLRLPPGLHRRRPRTRRRRGTARRIGCRFEVAARRRVPGHLRRRRHLRRAPRHGRPARRRPPRARVANAGRHVHALRARGRRPGQRQPQPGGPAAASQSTQCLHTPVITSPPPAQPQWPWAPRPRTGPARRSPPAGSWPHRDTEKLPARRSTSSSKARPTARPTGPGPPPAPCVPCPGVGVG